MKPIDLSREPPTLRDLLDLARDDNLILTTSDGRQYVLAEIDDFHEEIRLVRQQPELMAFLSRRSEAGDSLTLDEVKRELNLT